MTWETVEFEKIIQAALVRDLSTSDGDVRFGYYTTARKYLVEEVLEQIKAIQPELTDHGPRHVRNVLENIQDLLGTSIGEWNKEARTLTEGELNGMELYVLGLSALFHDVGNVFARQEHQKQVAVIYDLARPSTSGYNDLEEKNIILEICRAHCGDAVDGSKNTLNFVTPQSKINRKTIRPILLASILRFADELAEGEQRTSNFMITFHKYDKESMPYHVYANCSSIDIDRGNGRICLRYHINIEPTVSEGIVGIPLEDLSTFLEMVYRRIEKVNQERQYAKYYCPLLTAFKETSASFSFWYKQHHQIQIDLDTIVLSDLIVPGDPQKSIETEYKKYKQDNLIPQLEAVIAQIDSSR
jgi:hypothetical protein